MSAAENQIPIAKMAPWDFWARPTALDLSHEDAAAIKDGSATPEQRQRGMQAGLRARDILLMLPTGVSRPS